MEEVGVELGGEEEVGVEGGEYVFPELPELPWLPELSVEGEEGRLDVLIYNNKTQNKICEKYKSNTN